MPEKHSLAEKLALVAELRLRAKERYGLEATHSVFGELDRLDLDCNWDAQDLRRVERAFEHLEVERKRSDMQVRRMPPPESFRGAELFLGEAPNLGSRPTPVSLPSSACCRHLLLAGPPGVGKSTLARRLVNTVEKKMPWVRIFLVDPSRSYEALCADPSAWLSLPWSDLRLSPFCAPRGCPYRLWLPGAVDLLARGELMHSRYLLMKRTDALACAAGVPPLDDGLCHPPSLIDLRDDLATRRERPGSPEERYRAAALNVIDGRIRTSGDVFDCCRGMEDALSAARCRLDCRGLSPIETFEYVITTIIRFLFSKRMSEPLITPPELHTIVILEEAQSIVGADWRAGAHFYHELLLQSRALGLGFVFIAHDLEKIDNTVLSAVSNFALFAQSSASNKKLAANLLNLSPEETELLGRLTPGQCFMRMVGHASWPHPFLMRISP